LESNLEGLCSGVGCGDASSAGSGWPAKPMRRFALQEADQGRASVDFPETDSPITLRRPTVSFAVTDVETQLRQ